MMCNTFYTNSDHLWCWEKLHVRCGNVIGVIMNGYPEMVKNPFVVPVVKVHTGTNPVQKRRRNRWQLMVNLEKLIIMSGQNSN